MTERTTYNKKMTELPSLNNIMDYQVTRFGGVNYDAIRDLLDTELLELDLDEDPKDVQQRAVSVYLLTSLIIAAKLGNKNHAGFPDLVQTRMSMIREHMPVQPYIIMNEEHLHAIRNSNEYLPDYPEQPKGDDSPESESDC